MIDPHVATAFSVVLLGLGVLGVFVRRSDISVLLSLELMLCAAVLALVSFDRMLSRAGNSAEAVAGQGFAVLLLSLGMAQTLVGLGLLIAVRRTRDRAERGGGSPPADGSLPADGSPLADGSPW